MHAPLGKFFSEMAIGRLLSPKLSPHFNSKGSIPLTRRWVSSSPQDGRKFERVSDSENKDIVQKEIHWYSLGALMTNLKQRITGSMLSTGKASGEDSVFPEDVTAIKVVSLQNVVANKNCTALSIKEESSVSEMGSQDASQSLAGTKTSGKRETSKFQPEKAQSDLRKPWQKLSQNKLSNKFINPDPDKEVKLPLISEALNSSNSSMATGEYCSDGGDQHGLFGKMLSDPVQKIKSISKENGKHKFSGAFQNPDFLTSFLLKRESHEQKSRDLAGIRERKRKFSFERSGKSVLPVEMNAESGINMLLDSLKLPTCNNADASSWNPNGGEGKCAFKGDAVKKKSSSFYAKEEEESNRDTLMVQDQSLCSPGNPKLRKKSVGALSVEEHFPNKVLIRFLKETSEKKDIIEVFSEFGAVLDVQEILSFKGCIYKDALVTFKTNSAVKKALKKAHVMVMNQYVVVEATSKEDMVQRICIPDLIGDREVPFALVKKPTRTVKIHPLEDGISSNQIKEALRFCRSDISKFILGSSKTAAFVEFETEDGKERALAGHSISISNKKELFISRIDVPRTTVARISNLSVSAERDLCKLCKPYGEINQVITKWKGISDVWFDVSEWPNMLTILNSLNGKEIDGMKWVVRPATTVIPPEILSVLWEDPREKRYVKSVIQNLVREIEQPLDASRSYTLVTELVL